jgi:hypothetical protein
MAKFGIHLCYTVMLSVVVLNVIMKSVIMPNVITHSVVILVPWQLEHLLLARLEHTRVKQLSGVPLYGRLQPYLQTSD